MEYIKSSQMNNYLREKIEGCPHTVVADFLSVVTHTGAEDETISVEESVDEHGIISISYRKSNLVVEDRYQISLDNARKDYKISRSHTTAYEWPKTDSCITEVRELSYDMKEQGYVLASEKHDTGKTKDDKARFGFVLTGNSSHSKSFYTEAGVEKRSEDIIDYHYDVDDRPEFEHVAAGLLRNNSKTYVNTTYRQSLLNCVMYQDVYGINRNDFIERKTYYMTLNPEHNLGSMSGFSHVTEDENEFQQRLLNDQCASKETVERNLSRTTPEEKEDLLRTYYPEMVSSKHI